MLSWIQIKTGNFLLQRENIRGLHSTRPKANKSGIGPGPFTPLINSCDFKQVTSLWASVSSFLKQGYWNSAVLNPECTQTHNTEMYTHTQQQQWSSTSDLLNPKTEDGIPACVFPQCHRNSYEYSQVRPLQQINWKVSFSSTILEVWLPISPSLFFPLCRCQSNLTKTVAGTEGKANLRNLESYSLCGKMRAMRMILMCQV